MVAEVMRVLYAVAVGGGAGRATAVLRYKKAPLSPRGEAAGDDGGKRQTRSVVDFFRGDGFFVVFVRACFFVGGGVIHGLKCGGRLDVDGG